MAICTCSASVRKSWGVKWQDGVKQCGFCDRALVASDESAGVDAAPTLTIDSAMAAVRQNGLWQGLADHRFERFITRRIAGVVYLIGLWATILVAVVVAFAIYDQFRLISGWALLAFPGTALLAFLFIVGLRLAVEGFVALVVIAETVQDRLR